MRRFFQFFALMFILFIAYSGLYVYDISSKTEFWQQKVNAEIPVGSSFDDFEVWAKINNLNFRKNTGVEGYYASVDSSLPFPVCQRWVSIRFDFNADHKITKSYSNDQIICW